MGLRERAAADLQAITESTAGFGQAIRITNPDGIEVEVVGLTKDVAVTIDPDTGMAVTGRTASIAVSLKSLEDAGILDMPRAISDQSAKPWLVAFTDLRGTERLFKVQEALPDRTLPIVVCLLEAYQSS